MKKTRLDDLLNRYVTGQVTERERQKVEAWLDVKKTGAGANFELTEEDEELLFQKISANIDNVAEIRNFRPRHHRLVRFTTRPFLRVAAAVLILLVSSYIIWSVVDHHPPLREMASHGNVEKFILDDGSIVWLRGNSQLTYSEKTDGLRKATLQGEGLFEVAKDPERPFVISCGNIAVRVLGTSFNLRTTTKGVELNVLTGIVNLSSPGSPAMNVSPNEKVFYGPAGAIETNPITSEEVMRLTARTDYNMTFTNRSMADVIERIETKFNVKVDVAEKKLYGCRITADLTDHSLESTFAMLAEFLDIQYRIEGNSVTVTGRGCD